MRQHHHREWKKKLVKTEGYPQEKFTAADRERAIREQASRNRGQQSRQ